MTLGVLFAKVFTLNRVAYNVSSGNIPSSKDIIIGSNYSYFFFLKTYQHLSYLIILLASSAIKYLQYQVYMKYEDYFPFQCWNPEQVINFVPPSSMLT